MAGRSRSAPFSTHARGVPLFDKSRFLDIPRHATSALLDLRDIGSSAFWFLSMQSWLTVWSIFINIVSVIFFCLYDHNGRELAAELDFTFIAFTVILPLLGFIWIAYSRKERCLNLLSEIKCTLTSILTAHQQWLPQREGTTLIQVQIATANIIAAMRAYFLPSRFYSRNYPYFGYKSAMIQIALDRARSQRQIKDGIATISSANAAARGAGLSPALEALLQEQTLKIAIAIDQLSNVKEFGTPQGVRSVARFYICLVIPLFFAPYWAWVQISTNFALVFFISIVVQIALVGIMNVALALEDPFDNSGQLDGIFIDEPLFEIEQALLASGADPALLNSAVENLDNGGAAAGGMNGVAAGGAAAGIGGAGNARPGTAGSGAGAGAVPPPPQRGPRVATDTV